MSDGITESTFNSEADLGAVDVVGLGEVAQEAFQADPVGLDRLR